MFDWATRPAGVFRSRSKERASRNQGIVELSLTDEGKFRDVKLEKLDSYYENRQHDHLPAWDQAKGVDGRPLPVRKRKPRFQFAFASTLSKRVATKLIGQSVFPSINIEESPDDQEYFRAVVRETDLRSWIMEPVRRTLNTGACFVRFYLEEGAIQKKWYHAKYCYPKFQPNGQIETITIKYVYTDKEDKREDGTPKEKWYKLDLTPTSEILYDNPEYHPGVEPEFEEAQRVDHNLGFVQGEWFSTTGDMSGYGLIEDILPFIDELNYSLTQSSQAVSYNQDPQLTFKGVDEEELGSIMQRSSEKAWVLGREGEAGFLESNLNGVQIAMELRDKVTHHVQDITRIVMLDPEKIVGSAQSAKAMEVLHGPLKDLVDELREPIGKSLKSLIIKMGLAIQMANIRGLDVPLMIPPGYMIGSINIEMEWPEIFQQTMQDLLQKVQMVNTAVAGNLVSRRTGVAYLAKDFGVEDIEAELNEINTQPQLNPFGMF